MASDQTYVQAIIEHNKAIFEPDSDAVNEAFEVLKSNQGNIIHSYDSINDQENAVLQGEVQDDSLPHE